MSPKQMPNNATQTIDAIIETNREICMFWSKAHGWAPIEAAELMSKSRLDWQVELSRTLHIWVQPPEHDVTNGHLILGWANLGALVEGSLKWFLSVYYDDYKADVEAMKNKKGDTLPPDGVSFERLRQFFKKRIWVNSDSWDDWVLMIQQRRNAIHAYKDREIGTLNEFVLAVNKYYDFLSELNSRVPNHPDFPPNGP